MMIEKLVFGIYHDTKNNLYRTHADIDPEENAMLYLFLAQAQHEILSRMKPIVKMK